MIRLVTINYETLSYAEQRASDIMDGWGIDPASRRHTDDVANRPGRTLFGPPMACVLTIRDKSMLEAATSAMVAEGAAFAGAGVVMLAAFPENTKAMKAFMAAVRGLGGVAETPKKNRDGEITAIMSTIHLNARSAEFLLSYVGGDYEILLPLAKSITMLPRAEQEALTVDDLIVRLPDHPGEITVWGDFRKHEQGLDDLVMAGDRGAALARLRRILAGGTQPLVVLAFLRNRFAAMYQLKTMLAAGVDASTAAVTLGLPDPAYSGKGRKDPKTGKSGYPTLKTIRALGGASASALTNDMREFVRISEIMKGQHPTIRMDAADALIHLVATITMEG